MKNLINKIKHPMEELERLPDDASLDKENDTSDDTLEDEDKAEYAVVDLTKADPQEIEISDDSMDGTQENASAEAIMLQNLINTQYELIQLVDYEPEEITTSGEAAREMEGHEMNNDNIGGVYMGYKNNDSEELENLRDIEGVHMNVPLAEGDLISEDGTNNQELLKNIDNLFSENNFTELFPTLSECTSDGLDFEFNDHVFVVGSEPEAATQNEVEVVEETATTDRLKGYADKLLMEISGDLIAEDATNNQESTINIEDLLPDYDFLQLSPVSVCTSDGVALDLSINKEIDFDFGVNTAEVNTQNEVKTGETEVIADEFTNDQLIETEGDLLSEDEADNQELRTSIDDLFPEYNFSQLSPVREYASDGLKPDLQKDFEFSNGIYVDSIEPENETQNDGHEIIETELITDMEYAIDDQLVEIISLQNVECEIIDTEQEQMDSSDEYMEYVNNHLSEIMKNIEDKATEIQLEESEVTYKTATNDMGDANDELVEVIVIENLSKAELQDYTENEVENDVKPSIIENLSEAEFIYMNTPLMEQDYTENEVENDVKPSIIENLSEAEFIYMNTPLMEQDYNENEVENDVKPSIIENLSEAEFIYMNTPLMEQDYNENEVENDVKPSITIENLSEAEFIYMEQDYNGNEVENDVKPSITIENLSEAEFIYMNTPLMEQDYNENEVENDVKPSIINQLAAFVKSINNVPCTEEEVSSTSLPNESYNDMLMDQKSDIVVAATPGTSKPIHVQRVINATNLDILKQSYESSREVDSDISDEDDEVVVDDESIEAEREQSDDGQNEPEFRDLFNFDNCDPERSWLTSVFQENAHDVTQLNHNFLIQQHAERKKVVFTRERCMRSMYYSVGLLSSFDKYPEIKKIRGKPPKKKVPKEDIAKSPHYSAFSDVLDDGSNDGVVDLHFDADGQNQDEDSSINSDLRSNLVQAGPSGLHRKKARKFKDEESKKKWEDVMTLKRKKVFTSIVKKEVSKQHRAKMNKHKEMLIQCKRVALQCQKVVRQKALHSARVVKEQQWRMKRLARENLAYWKRSKRVDREIRRKLEKEAEEQRKMDFEFIEAKRQQRKLNFLITQTELYAHFMSKKLGTGSPEEQLRILNQLDEEKNPRLANIDDYDSDLMKAKAMRNAEEAFQNEKARTKNFDVEAHSKIDKKKKESAKGEHPQPAVFQGNLKGYQLKGMNWLANLYDQGISGILADEMGLGKTVQSIAFLCHIAERYSVWGPFLIISPASTLHNWQQEIAKFVPHFKVVPYWGNPNERKILRQFWDQKDMHTKDASFHIVVTSYQIVITDIKYFNRIKWQYMILDEAQAIKSTSSMRWKTLLGFSCRNRLLLSGTPIQNSMAELWALLHFIMPTLFDSHEEFNEWFSKDIESHAENKTGIDEKHLSRLHMILKPFMLRRIKKDVENELSDKIEVMVYCPLTTRQKLLYMALKQKIRIEDLLHYTVGGGDSHTVDKNFTSNLMNLVMQFRKVCNHPELFERRDAKSPIYIPPFAYEIPFLVYDSNVRQDKAKVIQKYFSFTPQYVAHAIRDYFAETIFNFAYTFKLSTEDLSRIFSGDILHRWKNYFEIENDDYNSYYKLFWSKNKDRNVNLQRIRSLFKMSPAFVNMSNVLKDLTFAWQNSGKYMIYTHTTHAYYSMPETVEHKNIRSKTANIEDCEPIIDVVNDDPAVKLIKEFPYEERTPQMFECERTLLPSFLFSAMPKLETTSPMLYCYSRKAAWDWKRFIDDYSWNSLQYHWSHSTDNVLPSHHYNYITRVPCGPVDTIRPNHGWSHIAVPDKETLVTDSGKLSVLDGLLKRLKEEGHRVLIYSQMTKMIDLLEEYMWHRHHKYMRLDGSSKISERRDMVADFQARTDIFVFLLSTRAGGLGINLTAADTVIFYDSDWNPTVDQQAMDRAHRLGQTKQVTVYRLICKGSIEERILQRAREKSEIQKLVISGGNFKPDTLKPKEVVSLLLDDEEIEQKYRQRTEERKQVEDMREVEKKRKHMAAFKTTHMATTEVKKLKQEGSESGMEDQWLSVDSGPSSPHSDISPVLTASEDVNDGSFLDVEGDTSINSKYTVYNLYGSTVKPRIPGRGSSKRGRPRGSRRVSALGRFNSNVSSTSVNIQASQEPVTDLNVSPSTSGIASLDLPGASSTSPSFPSQSSTTSSNYTGSPTVRRGPGRPRLKPGGPPHAGSRGPYRPRKPARPLPVPLPSDGGGNASASNTGYSSYLYDYPDQPSDS